MLRPIETHYFKLKVSKYKKTVEKKSEWKSELKIHFAFCLG